ncbi:EamA family transporter [Pseudahrensia aquimaris]|uniref:EamA family transporter n=1 Tax=Pseudahrensia aquimaris TaxID=744461 RepID=A0ABW3FE02_9HYPH
MELWVLITIGAAFMQNVRTAYQKALKGQVSTVGAASTRFFFALPFIWLYVWALFSFGGYEAPDLNIGFWLWLSVAGISQILFTVTLVWLFSFRSFAVGVTLSKLDVILIAVFGLLFLGDGLEGRAIVAIGLGIAGTLLLSVAQIDLTWRTVLKGVGEKSTGIGVLCAALLGLSSTGVRGALLTLPDDPLLSKAAYALALMLTMQCIVMLAYFLLRDRAELGRIARAWRLALPVGLSGVIGSVGWFSAYSLQAAAYVSAVGKIELVFSYLSSLLIFRESVSRMELVGMVMIGLGVVLIALP